MSGERNEPPLRILHVISGLDRRSGGPPTALAGLARAQAKAGMQVAVVATYHRHERLELAEELRRDGIGVVMVGPVLPPLGWHPRLHSALREAISSTDVVHIHTVWEQAQHAAAVICQKEHKPYVISPHGMLTQWSLAHSSFRKTLYMAWRTRRNMRYAAAVHFTTEAERYASLAGLPLVDQIVESLGVELAEFANLPARGDFRALHPELQDRFVVTFLGRIHPGKGVEHLLPAIAMCRDTSIHALIVGPDSEGFRERMRQLADSLGIRDRVTFTGMLTGREKLSALVDSDVFCLPSEHENFGVAIIEAMACHLPVIISDRVNICRDIERSGAGIVTHLEVPHISAAIHQLYTDSPRRQKMASLAADFVRQQYDWDSIAARWSVRLAGYAGRAAGSAQPSAGEATPPRLRVVHVISSLDRTAGGPINALMGLCQAQAQCGMDVSVVSAWRDAVPASTLSELHGRGIQFHVLGPTWSKVQWHSLMSPLLHRIIAESDIVHIHGVWEELLHRAATVARKLNKPYIIRPCGMLDEWSLAQNRFAKKLYLWARLQKDLDRASTIHYTTIGERNSACPCKAPAQIEPNGIDLSLFRELPKKGALRVRLGIDRNRPIIAFLGRVHPGKGIEYLIPALAAIAKTRSAVGAQANVDKGSPALVVIGPDSDGYQAQMIDLASSLGLKAAVRSITPRAASAISANGEADIFFTGSLYDQDKVAALVDADLFCLPSEHENFGIAAAEAMAAGLPVLVTKGVQLADELTACGGGVVVPADPAGLAGALNAWLTDPPRCRDAGQRGRAYAQEAFNWTCIASRWEQHYLQLIEPTVSRAAVVL